MFEEHSAVIAGAATQVQPVNIRRPVLTRASGEPRDKGKARKFASQATN
jgi:hypothetical protein